MIGTRSAGVRAGSARWSTVLKLVNSASASRGSGLANGASTFYFVAPGGILVDPAGVNHSESEYECQGRPFNDDRPG